MALVQTLSPTLDGGSVSLGSSATRTVLIPAEEFATPFWVSDGTVVHKVTELPWQGTVVGGSVQVSSSNPSNTNVSASVDALTLTEYAATVAVSAVNVNAGVDALTLTEFSASVSPSASTPFYSVNFDDYTGRADMLSDSQLVAWEPNASGAEISLTTGLTGTPWGGTKALRSTYYGGQGAETSAGLNVSIQNASTLQLREIWFELYFRFQATWTTNGPNAGNPDHKTFLLFDNAETGSQRWESQMGNTASELHGQYIAGTGDTSGDVTQFWDGNWYRARFHAKNGTDPASAGTAIWITEFDDGTLTRTWPGGLDATFSGNWFNKLAVFRNLNKGSSSDQWCEAADIKFYSSDPGWGI